MSPTDPNSSPKPGAQRLVQSRITSNFFSASKTPTTSSPYFTKPPPSTTHTSSTTGLPSEQDGRSTTTTSSVNLHPSRRSYLPRSPPLLKPSLSSDTNSNRRLLLSATAAETKDLLPRLLATAPHAPPHGQLIQRPSPLGSRYCPSLPPTTIRVLNADSLDTAIALSPSSPQPQSSPWKPPASRVLVLNMANAHTPGGGWLRGALAQEEALCYRSSLSFTLKTRFYPIPPSGAVYSPSVLIFRSSLASGHDLLDLTAPSTLPVVSVVSVAAVEDPKLTPSGNRYADPADRDAMKEKIRAVLRVAGRKEHRRLVLGALGCGAFGNPTAEVVRAWGEVFAEREFQGGWWEEIVFAVLAGKGDENFEGFHEGLDGVSV